MNDRIIEELIKQFGMEKTLELASKWLNYEKPLPTIDEFIDSNDYLGKILGGNVYPVWRELLRKVYPNPYHSPYVEIILTGAIGLGKTTVAKIGSTYDLYKLIQLENPQKTYNLLPTTTIVYAIINATKNLADAVIFDELTEWFQYSPAFKGLVAKAKANKSKTIFPKNVDIIVGSRPSHALGMAVFGAILDEMNFQNKVANQALENYISIKRRMQSRFSKGGKLPGHLWLISSKKSTSDFLDEHIEKSRHNKNSIVADYALWEVKGHLLNLSGKTFKVFIGDESRDPIIIDNKEVIKLLDLDPSKIIEVPIEFKKDFEYNIFEALGDLAGVSTSSVYTFIRSKEKIKKVCTNKNPVKKDIIQLGLKEYGSGSIKVSKFLEQRILKNLLNPDTPRYMHIDIGLTGDKYAIAVAHEFARFKRELQETVVEEPVVAVDFVMVFEAPHNDEIPIEIAYDLVMDLTSNGYYIKKVTADGFQSRHLLQKFKLSGFNSELLSVDRNTEPYFNFRRMIYDERVILPDHYLLKKELKELQVIKNKVDHPDGGSKDVTDAVCGAIWTCINDNMESSTPYSMLKDLTDEDIESLIRKYSI